VYSIVLFEPEIPPNTGNIIRLCANTGARLHLIEPLGFKLDQKSLRRAGLDYHELASVTVWPDLQTFRQNSCGRLICFSTGGIRCYSDVEYQPGDRLLFGPETRGLPDAVIRSVEPDLRLRIPMRADSRSLNLSNSVAVVAYEAWRQHGFSTGDEPSPDSPG
jgi:tRNA (cytidine/uridine-2'-O-)-methyltransferase